MKNSSHDITLCFCYLNNKFSIELKSFISNFFTFYNICSKNLLLNLSSNYFKSSDYESCQTKFELEFFHLFQETSNLSNRNQLSFSSQDVQNTNTNHNDMTNDSFFESATLNEKVFMFILTFLYTITVVISVIGNFSVIVVMSCGFRSSYLDISIFLVNLGIFNLLMSIFCIPFTFVNTLLKKWIFPAFMCPLTSFFQLLSVNGVILTLVYLAINRYYAVVNPLRYNSEKTKNQKRRSILAIWLISITLSIFQLFIYKCDPPTDEQIVSSSSNETELTYCYCQEIWDPKNVSNDAKYYLAYTLWIFLETYALPCTIIIIMYSKIISILWKRNCNNREYFSAEHINSDSFNEKLKSRTLKVLF